MMHKLPEDFIITGHGLIQHKDSEATGHNENGVDVHAMGEARGGRGGGMAPGEEVHMA